ncbi:GAF domain-containing protein [Celeribacter indicus]|uniref:Fis family transcriptional regulator n=1 Tax=Celeribacter indicus TaxID=1208324 RepID=A0A0B5E0X4_9RHOB|nr:GAF domain-containing protein [Celeribacter indicus]AJE48939.1 Fis family transcriptional regulator [Celeribacter indicus]SDW41762.1 GAF domain-containing protein [Celeribacter indicus]
MDHSSHADYVISTIESAAVGTRLTASWRRSLMKHGLHPGHGRGPRRFSGREIAERRERLGAFRDLASPKLDQLFQMVGNTGCSVLMTDRDGIILDQRSKDGDAGTFQAWGLWTGCDWSEAAEGTNGIGTCLAEERQVTIHRDEHFLSRNTAMSCMDAPIFGPDGRLIAALDVSSCRADQTEAYARLIAGVVAQTARQIETDAFRAAFAGARILSPQEERPEGALLLAVDQDDLVIGATRAARRAFGLGPGAFDPRPASDILGRDTTASALERAERAALRRAIARTGGNVSAAARELGIGRATLYRRMKRLGIGET